jgi:hypothetical protein
VLIARGFVRRDSGGGVVITSEGDAYLRDELADAIRESAEWLKVPYGPENT